MPGRRRLGTGENITRSGLIAHLATRRPKSSAQPAMEDGSSPEKVTYACSHLNAQGSLPYEVDQKMGSGHTCEPSST